MRSIRHQLFLTMLLGFGVLLLGSGAGIYFFTRMALVREFDAGLQARAQTIMSAVEQGEDGFQFESGDMDFPGAGRNQDSPLYEIWLANGKVGARSESLKTVDLPQRAGSLASPDFWNLTLPDGRPGRAIGLRFPPKVEHEDGEAPAAAPEVTLVVASGCRGLDHTLGVLATMLAAAGLLALLLTMPMVSVSLRRGHAPLDLLARQAAAINADSLQTRFPVDSLPAELQPIAGRLNDLLERLEASFERERRFSADLAHELRTPLAELRTLAEVELRWAQGAEADKHRETLEITLQMETMVARLLELARSENNKIIPQWEQVMAAPLLEEVWRPLAGKAEKKRLTTNFNAPATATLRTDRVLFRSILANLLSNAVEYAPEHGRIEVDWPGAGGELTVSNTVDDLTADDVTHLFERLWRKDKSRTGNDHCGLGLAVSREFARLLGLELTARLDREKTLTLSVKAFSKVTGDE